MDFTYESYGKLLSKLCDLKYDFANYHNWSDKEKCVILRHDIDFDVSKARQMAEFEKSKGINSTYFVLLTSDFYNVFSKQTRDELLHIVSMGHDIGLHFDETCYSGLSGDEIKDKIICECRLLGEAVERSITTVSMHRPSEYILEADISIPNIVNSYSSIFFKQFKYISDSRMRWREPVDQVIQSCKYNRIHILTHAFWYSNEERKLYDILCKFIEESKYERYLALNSNFTDLKTVISEKEVCRCE